MGKLATKRKVSGDVAVIEPPGVRTRSKVAAAASYLQLRSRRLEKRAPPRKGGKPRKAEVLRPRKEEAEGEASPSPEVEASFGDNALQLEDGRNDRESTPCSLIMSPESVATPGSSTRPARSSMRQRGSNDGWKIIPSTKDVEDMFAKPTQLQQKAFAEKYNFDPVKERPLPGRYEWVKLNP